MMIVFTFLLLLSSAFVSVSGDVKDVVRDAAFGKCFSEECWKSLDCLICMQGKNIKAILTGKVEFLECLSKGRIQYCKRRSG